MVLALGWAGVRIQLLLILLLPALPDCCTSCQLPGRHGVQEAGTERPHPSNGLLQLPAGRKGTPTEI